MNITPIELVLRCCAATEGASETPANTNAGPYVERVLRICGLTKGQPWCACEVANIGTAALKELWPVPRTGGCQALHDWAKRRAILELAPAVGDVFLIWHPELGRFAHTGFVLELKGETARTHEGNTSGGGSREGWIVAHRTRRFKPEDRFIRWASLVAA